MVRAACDSILIAAQSRFQCNLSSTRYNQRSQHARSHLLQLRVLYQKTNIGGRWHDFGNHCPFLEIAFIYLSIILPPELDQTILWDSASHNTLCTILQVNLRSCIADGKISGRGMSKMPSSLWYCVNTLVPKSYFQSKNVVKQ